MKYFIPTLLLLLSTQSIQADDVDLKIIHQIKDQAFNHSRVMDYMHVIADVNGARVTGSPGYLKAANSTIAAMKQAGIKNARLEPWGIFGRGWSWTRIAVQMKKPDNTTLTGFPADWTAATDGPVIGEVVFAPLWEEDDKPTTYDLEKKAYQIERYIKKHQGTLKGKIVMVDLPTDFKLPTEPHHYRYDQEALTKRTEAPAPGEKPPLEWPIYKFPANSEKARLLSEDMPLEVNAERWDLEVKLHTRLEQFWHDEGVSALLKTTWSQAGGVIMQSNFGSYRDGDPIAPATAVLMPEHYNRIHRLLKRDVPVEIEVDIDSEFHGPAVQGINVIAEISGKGKKNEIVMLGAHLDSWHGATGATDNAAGSAVVMEAMRILKTLNLDMKRTVRAALWDGEEQGLFGSRAYVAKHFAEPVSMKLNKNHAKLSGYFNLDNGSGKIRGVYLQKNDMMRPIFDSWFAPFSDLGVTSETIANTQGTDHLSFDAVGLPGFQFIQDPLDYNINTHHSNLDHLDHVVAGDLMQAAAVMAATIYQTATRKEMLPRKVLPKPLPKKKKLPAILESLK